jgi:hypothetical protein
VEKGKKKKSTEKKRGGQPGHAGYSRPLYPVEECESVTDYYPKTCSCCGEELKGFDPNPYRHQVVEIPPIPLPNFFSKPYVQSAPIVAADETGFGQGNTDGQNPANKRAWLWVAVTPLVSFCSTAAAQSLLGENFSGILNSDRYNRPPAKVSTDRCI